MGVGRGDRTLMIDSVLEQTTPNWDDLDTKKGTQPRALFHERIREAVVGVPIRAGSQYFASWLFPIGEYGVRLLIP